MAATACGPSACKTVELDRPTSAKPSHGAPRQLPKGVAPLQLPPAGREVDLVLEAASPLSPGPRNRRRSRIMSDELAFERAEAADGEGGSEDAADGGDGGGGACTKEPLMLDVLGYRFDRFFGNWKSVCMLLIATVSLVISGYAYWLAGGAADLTESVWKVRAAAVVASILSGATVIATVPEQPVVAPDPERCRRAGSGATRSRAAQNDRPSRVVARPGGSGVRGNAN